MVAMIKSNECRELNRYKESIAWTQKIRKVDVKLLALSRPTAAIVDRGRVRIGDGFITAEFPART
jgi:hypothetical protein